MAKSIPASVGNLVDSSADVVSNSVSIVSNLGSILGNSLGLLDVGLELGAEAIQEYTEEVSKPSTTQPTTTKISQHF